MRLPAWVDRLRTANAAARADVNDVATIGPVLTALPFAAIAVIGQLVAVWGPNPLEASEAVASTALLVAALIGLAVPAVREAPWGPSAILVTYVASVTLLVLAEGKPGSGLGVLLLVPLVASALFFGYRETVVATVAVLGSIVSVALVENLSTEVTIRRIILWTSICVLVAVPIDALRAHLRHSVVEARRLLQQSRTLESAARQLTSLRGEDEILAAAVDLASLVVATPGEPPPIATYLRADEGGGVGCVASSAGTEPPTPAVDALEASLVPLVRHLPADRPCVEATARVSPEGTLHGYLHVTVARSLTDDSLDGLTALAQLVELTLSDHFAHRRLEDHAMLEERRRIARELHDGLAHELAFIASRARSRAQDTADQTTAELARSAERALDEARRAITVLSSPEPQLLQESVVQTAEDLGARYGLPIGLDFAPDIDVDPSLGEHLLRIVREAVCNAARHGSPTQITIRFWDDGVRHLVIEDDGIGFDPTRAQGGFGLISMRERAEAIGGELTLHSVPDAGTRVEVLVP
jgi:signal transduction histidine kinase